jgi:glycosyltransferase involved in cell wall biosynthesis
MDVTVSVIIPVYNSARYLPETIESVLRQTYSNWEVVMVDDGSKDNSAAVAAQLAARHPDKVRLLFHSDKGNHGVSATRNLAIRESRGSFIATLDADDVWLSNKLERQMDVFQRFPDVGLVYTQATCVDEETKPLTIPTGAYGLAGNVGAGEPNQSFAAYEGCLMDEVFAPTPSVMVRRNLLEAVQGFPLGLRSQCEDAVTWTKIAASANFYFIQEPLALYRVHAKSWSGRQNPLSIIDVQFECLQRVATDTGMNPTLAQGLWRLQGLYYRQKETPFFNRLSRIMAVSRFLAHHHYLFVTWLRQVSRAVHRLLKPGR